MVAFSNYLESAILAWFRGFDMPSAPSAVYVALFNGSPGEDGLSGTEVTETARTAGRVAVNWSLISQEPPGPQAPGWGSIHNDTPIEFGYAENPVTFTFVALFDAPTGGNMLAYGPLDQSRNFQAGDPIVFPIARLVLQVG